MEVQKPLLVGTDNGGGHKWMTKAIDFCEESELVNGRKSDGRR